MTTQRAQREMLQRYWDLAAANVLVNQALGRVVLANSRKVNGANLLRRVRSRLIDQRIRLYDAIAIITTREPI